MKVFEITGDFEQYRDWTNDAFKGYFVQEEGSDEFVGFMEELYKSPYDSMRYIRGYFLGKKLVFYKLSNESILAPLLYVFKDIDEEGYWKGYNLFSGFKFAEKNKAIVRVKEVTENSDEVAQNAKEIYQQIEDEGVPLNMVLLKETGYLRKLLSLMK